ncbi:hypothetical protein [Kumtagia ephedrae]|uniref:Uncharacterized protein n=1 Tax=Kumtagia ephedrae TaxID=2116701 RepID=A0A2P7RXB9_9HYPH|nr:hypothetical protein [Mesorhizobium ephedrae]PSJ54868.1 hypothetical protein C7I84_23995 [Mesorhizobium ephedrae]
MTDMTLILNRRREVEQEIARLKDALSVMEAELVELATAERVMSRLTGAERPSAGATDQPKPPATARPSARKATMPEMITKVLQNADYEAGIFGGVALEPKEIGRRIEQLYGVIVRGEAVSSICWRMWKRGQLAKDEGSSSYHLPTNNKSAKEAQGSAFADLLGSPNMQDREAGPGGGT